MGQIYSIPHLIVTQLSFSQKHSNLFTTFTTATTNNWLSCDIVSMDKSGEAVHSLADMLSIIDSIETGEEKRLASLLS